MCAYIIHVKHLFETRSSSGAMVARKTSNLEAVGSSPTWSGLKSLFDLFGSYTHFWYTYHSIGR
jgi:hypothetical protein